MIFYHHKYFEFWKSCLGILAVTSAVEAKPASVVLVKSALRTEYEQTSRAIVSSLEKADPKLSIEEILFDNNSGRENVFWNKVIEKRPELIITMGTPATRSAIRTVTNLPIIFTVVLDNIRDMYPNADFSEISGVTLAIPVNEQLEMMRKALPDIRRVGFIYSSSSAHMHRSAGNIASRMGLRLVDTEIASERDIPAALRRILPEVDIFWMPPDAVTYEPNILRFILLECYKNSMPIAAVSKRIAMAGTPLALGIDYDDIGKQTAELVLKKLSGRHFSNLVIEHPRKVILYINEGVATSLGLNIPQEVMEQAISVKSWRY